MAASFSQNVKSEILESLKGAPPCCETAFLAGFIRAAGSIAPHPKGLGFSVKAENPGALKKLKSILVKLYGANAEIAEEYVAGFNRLKYTLKVTDGEKILGDCGILEFDDAGLRLIKNGFDQYLVEERCCAEAFVKAVFLGAGYVTLPDKKKKERYHLEFAFTGEDFEEDFYGLLCSLGFIPKKVRRKSGIVLYFKDSEEISDILAFLGAVKNVFKLVNTVAERSVRNRANRQANCISANIDRTVEAAERQMKEIRLIEERTGLENLPPTLRNAAALRRENTSESLDELAALSGISKSGLNHRFRKISEIAKKLKEPRE